MEIRHHGSAQRRREFDKFHAPGIEVDRSQLTDAVVKPKMVADIQANADLLPERGVTHFFTVGSAESASDTEVHAKCMRSFTLTRTGVFPFDIQLRFVVSSFTGPRFGVLSIMTSVSGRMTFR